VAATDALSDTAIASIADAMFASGPPVVVEAYSQFDSESLRFESACVFCAYALQQRNSPSRSAHVALHYPDVGGRLELRRINLDPAKTGGATYRFAAEGWGLVFVNLHVAGRSTLGSFVSANSEKRALKWSSTCPELGRPEAWVWPAVARHARRITRVLKAVV
jgi:hypothetical protein